MSTLQGARILLLEDDALISIDTEDMLLSLGAARILIAHTIEEAAAIFAGEEIDAAVLDLVIGHDRCEDFARRLVENGTPWSSPAASATAPACRSRCAGCRRWRSPTRRGAACRAVGGPAGAAGRGDIGSRGNPAAVVTLSHCADAAGPGELRQGRGAAAPRAPVDHVRSQ